MLPARRCSYAGHRPSAPCNRRAGHKSRKASCRRRRARPARSSSHAGAKRLCKRAQERRQVAIGAMRQLSKSMVMPCSRWRGRRTARCVDQCVAPRGIGQQLGKARPVPFAHAGVLHHWQDRGVRLVAVDIAIDARIEAGRSGSFRGPSQVEPGRHHRIELGQGVFQRRKGGIVLPVGIEGDGERPARCVAAWRWTSDGCACAVRCAAGAGPRAWRGAAWRFSARASALCTRPGAAAFFSRACVLIAVSWPGRRMPVTGGTASRLMMNAVPTSVLTMAPPSRSRRPTSPAGRWRRRRSACPPCLARRLPGRSIPDIYAVSETQFLPRTSE